MSEMKLKDLLEKYPFATDFFESAGFDITESLDATFSEFLDGFTEEELEEKEIIKISFGQDLSWKYLTWVRNHSFVWNHPTAILYGNYDNLQSIDTIQTFARECEATITVMKNGEHWFHTDEQMKFLNRWICS